MCNDLTFYTLSRHASMAACQVQLSYYFHVQLERVINGSLYIVPATDSIRKEMFYLFWIVDRIQGPWIGPLRSLIKVIEAVNVGLLIREILLVEVIVMWVCIASICRIQIRVLCIKPVEL